MADIRTRTGPDAANHFEEIFSKASRTMETKKVIEDLKEKVKNVEQGNHGVPEDWAEMSMKDTKDIVNETEQKMVSASHILI